MNRKIWILLVVAVGLSACRTHYEVAKVERSRILVDSRYDADTDGEAEAFLLSYKHRVDSMTARKVGRSAKYMSARRPESELSNLMADIMVWAGRSYDEKPDFGVVNMGGIRDDLPKGTVTYGDVLSIAPFENKIAFLTLTGDEVLELFGNIANNRGDGVSHGVELVITKDGKLVSARLNGQPIDPQRDYRIATIDFLLEGNGGMLAFKKGKNINSPQIEQNDIRYIIADYFQEMDRQGKVVDAVVEGRVRRSEE